MDLFSKQTTFNYFVNRIRIAYITPISNGPKYEKFEEIITKRNNTIRLKISRKNPP